MSEPIIWRDVPDQTASGPKPWTTTGTVNVPPPCPTCDYRLIALPQPHPERLSHVCVNGHKFRSDTASDIGRGPDDA